MPQRQSHQIKQLKPFTIPDLGDKNWIPLANGYKIQFKRYHHSTHRYTTIHSLTFKLVDELYQSGLYLERKRRYSSKSNLKKIPRELPLFNMSFMKKNQFLRFLHLPAKTLFHFPNPGFREHTGALSFESTVCWQLLKERLWSDLPSPYRHILP